MGDHQNLTVALKPATIRKAKILAAKKGSSISRLVAELIEDLVSQEERYENARRQAVAYLKEGFPLGGHVVASREEWHER